MKPIASLFYEQHVALDTLLPAPEFGRITLHGPLDQPTLKRLVHLVDDVRRDDAPLRKVAGIAGEFDKLRKNYLERREWSSLYVHCSDEQCGIIAAPARFNAASSGFVNLFLNAPAVTLAGSFAISGVNHHV